MKRLLHKLLCKKEKIEPVCSAVVAAAGSSRRMGGGNKLLLPLEGIPVLARTLQALDELKAAFEDAAKTA